jgi:flagellar basal-body rod modification protein FlgD
MMVENIVGNSSRSTSATTRSQMTRDQFIGILVAELTHQDPMAPMDNTQFLNQMTAIQNIETNSTLVEGIKSLLWSNQLGSASNMIGSEVVGVGDDGSSMRGVVEKVTVQDNKVRLIVNGTSMAMENVTEVLPYSLTL